MKSKIKLEAMEYVLGAVEDTAAVEPDLYTATVKWIAKGAKSVRMEFELQEACGRFSKSYDEVLTMDSPLYGDLSNILGQDLVQAGSSKPLDLNALAAGKSCRVFVGQRKGAGGALKTEILHVLPLLRSNN